MSISLSRRKKIAVVIPKYGLVGGAEGHTAALTSRLAMHSQYEVHVFANKWVNHPDNIIFHKVPIITFPKFLTTISFAYFAGARIARTNFYMVHTHERMFNADMCTLHGIPHEIWVRDVRKKRVPSLFDYGTMWVDNELATNGNCRQFIAVSNLTKEKFLEQYPDMDHDRVSVIHPGVDLETFTNKDLYRNRRGVRQQFGIGKDELVIIFVSMNYDIKGLDYLMMGLARFKEKHPKKNFKLLIVGKSNSHKYLSLAEEKGLRDHVIYTGVIEHEQIADLYGAADIFAMPSRFDTFGLTVLEAMAASLPVIISENVGAKDIVRQGENGFVVNLARHEEEIAMAVEILCHEHIRERMSREAFITASQHCWDKVAEKYFQAYEDLWRKKSIRNSPILN
ncbi:MAG: glycosyltransferase family 4 protein [Syntrophales bacterium]|nr:glycosyltransferase family 4 protein [Syntrophales bacterium]